jgi:hypothetical protein
LAVSPVKSLRNLQLIQSFACQHHPPLSEFQISRIKRLCSLALKKLRVSPKQSIFIDNQKWNISAAKKLGLKTILFIQEV